MNDLQAPWVGNAPYEEEQPRYCPCCGEECETYYVDRYENKIVGCENCIICIDSWEWEED